jgi:glyoxylase-like metal-dependent hydrolase (beta-lactamase superfamily II)
MLKIKRFVCNMLQENTYVVSDDSHEAIVIDCGAFFKEERAAITQYIEQNGLKPVRLLCTHGHFDHCCGNDTIYTSYGLKPQAPRRDAWLMETMVDQTQLILGVKINIDVPPIGQYLDADDTIDFGNHRLKVLPTPGHTPGSVLFHIEEEHVVFSGDTLFKMSIGRTDFDQGSYPDMMASLSQVVANLPPDTTVYTGHGPETTIAYELAYNPYLSSRL